MRFSEDNGEMTWIEIVPGLKVQEVACPGGSSIGQIGCQFCFGQSPLPLEALLYLLYLLLRLGWKTQTSGLSTCLPSIGVSAKESRS